MTINAIAAFLAAAASGCVCVCAAAEVRFEAACAERGGRVQPFARGREACIADAGIIATWVDDDAGAFEGRDGS